jgi:ribosomal protein S18 acetylase RimI-like enzyme
MARRYAHIMEVHRLTAGDVSRFRAIRISALRDAPTAFGTTFEEAAAWAPEVWTKLLSEIIVFVAVTDGDDVGLVRCASDRDVESAARLGSLWVAPKARGTGVAGSLVDAVVGWARSRGFAELLLEVSDDNRSSIAFYSRRGFEPNGEVGTLPPPRQYLRKHQRILRL